MRVIATKSFLKKILGVLLIVVGLLALVTPLTPGSWLAIIGLELLGLRELFDEQLQKRFPRLYAKIPARVRKR